MFDYYYCPESVTVEIKKQLKFFNHQAQIVLDGQALLDLAGLLLKAQMEGRYFELVVFLEPGYHVMELANVLHRLAQAGAKVSVIEGKFDKIELEIFAVFDNKLLISNHLHEETGSFMALIQKKHRDFEVFLQKGVSVNVQNQPLKMNFTASNYFVKKGEEVELYWNAENSSDQWISPQVGKVSPNGSCLQKIENDILFTFHVKNIKNKSLLSIFIKCVDEDPIKISIAVYNDDLEQYIPIEPIPENPSIYAVFKGDLIRVEWVTSPQAKLSEKELGELKNHDFINYIAHDSKRFQFTVKSGEIVSEATLTVVTLLDESISSVSDQAQSLEFNDLTDNNTKSIASIKGWWNRFIGFKKGKQ
jgi:hypothetical protein